MTLALLPVNAGALTHPMSDHFRADRAPNASLRVLREALLSAPGEAAIVAGWIPSEQKTTRHRGIFIARDKEYPLWLTAEPQGGGPLKPEVVLKLDSAFALLGMGSSKINDPLGRAWDACAAHLALDDIVNADWCVLMARDFCTFLRLDRKRPELAPRHILPPPAGGRENLLSDRLLDTGSDAPEAHLLTYVPFRDGMQSRHEEVAAHAARPEHIRRVLTALLPMPVTLCDPIT